MLSTFDLQSPEYQADPYPFYELMRQEGLTKLDPGGFYTVSRYSDVVAVLRNPGVFAASGLRKSLEPPWLGPHPCTKTMHSLDPPEHTKMRDLVSTSFLPSVIESSAPFIQGLVSSAVGRFAERGEAEAVLDIAIPVTAGAMGNFLKLDPSLHPKCKEWSDAYLSITPQPKSPEHERMVRTALEEMKRYFSEVLEERRRSPGDDMVSVLLGTEIDGRRLTHDELLGFFAMLLIAGMETTAHLIANSLLFLTTRPDVMSQLRADPKLVPSFVDEMLRHDPPVHGMPRFVKSDTLIAGQPVPAGSTVVLMLAAANRDERQFPNPDVFDMRRDLRGSVAFGHGIHFCIGMGLAKLEARLAITEVVKRFERLELAAPPVKWSHKLTVRGPAELPLRGIPA